MGVHENREKVLRIGGDAGLLGILTPGRQPSARAPAVLLLNPGTVRRVGTRRLYVRLARRLAEHGFTCVRFDFAGIGDSPARSGEASFMRGACADVGAVMDYLEDRQGFRSFLLIGLCSGADVAIAAARVDDRVAGVAQLNPWVHKNRRYYLHQFWRPRWWRKVVQKRFGWFVPAAGEGGGDSQATWGPEPTREETMALLADVAGRDVNLMVVLTSGLVSYDGQFQDVYPDAHFNEHFRCVRRMPSDHVISPMNDQAFVMDQIEAWMRETWPQEDSD
jgi:alpha/beta superfamily hydrolase